MLQNIQTVPVNMIHDVGICRLKPNIEHRNFTLLLQ